MSRAHRNTFRSRAEADSGGAQQAQNYCDLRAPGEPGTLHAQGNPRLLQHSSFQVLTLTSQPIALTWVDQASAGIGHKNCCLKNFFKKYNLVGNCERQQPTVCSSPLKCKRKFPGNASAPLVTLGYTTVDALSPPLPSQADIMRLRDALNSEEEAKKLVEQELASTKVTLFTIQANLATANESLQLQVRPAHPMHCLPLQSTAVVQSS